MLVMMTPTNFNYLTIMEYYFWDGWFKHVETITKKKTITKKQSLTVLILDMFLYFQDIILPYYYLELGDVFRVM